MLRPDKEIRLPEFISGSYSKKDADPEVSEQYDDYENKKGGEFLHDAKTFHLSTFWLLTLLFIILLRFR